MRKALIGTPQWCSLGEPGNEASPGIVLRTGDQQGNLGTRLAMGVYYVLVLTRGAMEPWSCTPFWCSSGEPGNKARPGILLRTGANQ